MFNFRNLILAVLCITFTSCYKKYIGTRNACGNNLYVETYQINLMEVDVCYLTDSTNFRIFVGRFDPQFATYDFKCYGDSVYIENLNNRNR